MRTLNQEVVVGRMVPCPNTQEMRVWVVIVVTIHGTKQSEPMRGLKTWKAPMIVKGKPRGEEQKIVNDIGLGADQDFGGISAGGNAPVTSSSNTRMSGIRIADA
jgi:hypothetical protein